MPENNNDGFIVQEKSPLHEFLSTQDLSKALIDFGKNLTDLDKVMMMTELTNEEIHIFSIYWTRYKLYPEELEPVRNFILAKCIMKVAHGRKGRNKIEQVLLNAFQGAHSVKDNIMDQLRRK